MKKRIFALLLVLMLLAVPMVASAETNVEVCMEDGHNHEVNAPSACLHTGGYTIISIEERQSGSYGNDPEKCWIKRIEMSVRCNICQAYFIVIDYVDMPHTWTPNLRTCTKCGYNRW